MSRRFNTAGPCRAEDHYMLPPEGRLTELRPLIEEKAYFVVHAPRQTGKTTCLESLAKSLTAEGTYAAVLTSCKVGESARGDVDRAVRAVIYHLAEEARKQLPEGVRPDSPESVDHVPGEARLARYLGRWCERSTRPVVLFLDEIDALVDDTLLSVLDQLHAGYSGRPTYFPHSVALIGLRDVRDYKVYREARQRLGSSSPFNIKLESLLLRDFTAEEVRDLYAQHTAETGQRFTEEAIALAFDLSRGQPWLANALARQVVTREVPDPGTTIEPHHFEATKEALILRRDTHLDSLIERLREERVRKVLEPILAGEILAPDVLNDDVAFVRDLGLVSPGLQGLEISNPLYREIVPRALTSLMELSLVLPRPSYVDGEGRLDMEQLLDDFRAFWIENAEPFLKSAPYSEAAAQLVFMAFLHKITNGKGHRPLGGSEGGHHSVDREYAAGRGRLDLCVRWPLPTGEVLRWAIELKVWRDTTPTGEGILNPAEKGVLQLTEYLERLGLDRGYLLLFDARSDAAPLPGRVSREELEHEGRTIVFWRL